MSNQFQVTKKVREAVILNLRRIFTGDPDYNYAETLSGEFDFDNTRIVISAVLPQEPAFFPAITVETVPGQEMRYLGPDALRATYDNNGVQQTDETFTSLAMTVTVSVHTIDDLKTKDQIIDRIYDHFKLITDDLASRGVEIKRTSFLTDRRSFNGDRWFITGGLSMEIYTEWKDDLGPGQHVVKIPISLTLIP